jgi:phosphoglucosamine mutase
MARRLFGTDGVRGVAGELLTADLAVALGRAATQQSGARRVLVIRDTRESGEMLEAALGAGVASAGGDVFLGGVLPTPAAPLLVGRYGFDLGVVISASHNPYRDNGIKFFGHDGYKLSDATEEAIEARLDDSSSGATRVCPQYPRSGHVGTGRIRALHGTEEDYLRELHTRFAGLDLNGVDVLLDCANGATYQAAPEIFRRLGADVTVMADNPDGRNINDGCGSTHVDAFAGQVVAGGHAIGFAFDGDGDRVLAVDRNGVVVDGDELIALAAIHMRDEGRLPGCGVAVTVMTNYGFHAAMKEHEIEVATTQVGDRYVIEELRARGWALGGEQSGHIIDTGFVPSGDGIASALLALEALKGGDLAQRGAMRKLPQRLVNVKVADRDAAMGSGELADAIAAESGGLEGRGRVLVRPSGTEQLVRGMVEAPAEDEADAVCARLVAVVERSASPA